MLAIGGCGVMIGTVFFLAGAWPVAGFCGLEIALVYTAFRLNFRDGRRAEELRLTRAGLDITRIPPRGERRVERLEPAWLTVEMDDPPRHDSRLMVRHHARKLEIGGFLLPHEKLEVAEALRAALARHHAAPDYAAPV